MAEEENPFAELINMPHGEQEHIKMKLLHLVQQGLDPYDIIYEIAKFLEKESGERGYAHLITDNIHTIYGLALDNKKPKLDELQEIENRITKIEAARSSGSFGEEENARMDFAIKAHKKRAAYIRSSLDGEIDKNN